MLDQVSLDTKVSLVRSCRVFHSFCDGARIHRDAFPKFRPTLQCRDWCPDTVGECFAFCPPLPLSLPLCLSPIRLCPLTAPLGLFGLRVFAVASVLCDRSLCGVPLSCAAACDSARPCHGEM